MPALRRFCLLITLVSPAVPAACVAPALAQDAQDADDAALTRPDMLRVELRRRARGTPDQLAQSIRDALRLRLEDEATLFLESVANRELDDAARARMVNIISGERLLRAAIDETLSEAAQEQAAALLEGKARYDRDPERIERAIGELRSGIPDRMLPAYRTLLAGGIASIGPLAHAAAAETDDRVRDEMLRLLARLGEPSLEALEQLAVYGDDDRRPGALDALDQLRRAAAVPHLAVALHSISSTDGERRMAEEILLDRYERLPSRQAAERLLLHRLADQRITAGRLSRTDATDYSWSLDPETGVPTATETLAGLAAQRRVADTTRLLHRLGGLSLEAARRALTADLAYRYQLDPLTVIEQADELRRLWGDAALDAASLSAVIGEAIRDDDLAAAVAAMSLVDREVGGDPADLMLTHSPVLTPLVEATMHSVPQVRYEAAAAIARLEFKHPYPGSSTLPRRWIEMAGLTREPLALLVETRVELEAHIERQIHAMGYRIEAVSSVAEAIERLDAGGDLRMVISTTILPDRSSLELVDAVRRHPFGLRIPILLHGPIDAGVEAAVEEPRWPAPVVHLPLPASVAGWGMELEPLVTVPLGRLQGLEPLTAVERFDFRRQATETLGRIAGEADAYDFYNFRQMADAALGAGQADVGRVPDVPFGDPRLALLSVAPDARSQAALVDMLIAAHVNEARSRSAAEALTASLERNGILVEGEVLKRLGRALESLDDGPRKIAIAEVWETIAQRLGADPAEAGADQENR